MNNPLMKFARTVGPKVVHVDAQKPDLSKLTLQGEPQYYGVGGKKIYQAD